MSIDLSAVVGYEFEPKESVYDEKDASLYALAIGAAADPLDPLDLQYVYELHQSGFAVFPTFGVTFPFTVLWQILDVPGLTFNPMMLLHGEQYLALRRPLPAATTLTNRARISNIYDKGKGALVIVDVHTVDAGGEEVAFNQLSLFIRGLGDFGGERGPANNASQPPQRPPDAAYRQQTNANQALWYRLASGDRNPLHADPQMAAFGGYRQPILHGLCTLGFGARAVLRQFGGNDAGRFQEIKARFTKHVFPGETIITEMWSESDTRILFQCKVAERDEMVVSNGAVSLQAP